MRSSDWSSDVCSSDLGWGLAFAGNFRLTANYATGFKAPTFNDLYYPFFGKPDLRPEESKGYNLGLARYAHDYSWTPNAHETRIDDLISYEPSIFLPHHLDHAPYLGLEITADTTRAGTDPPAAPSTPPHPPHHH